MNFNSRLTTILVSVLIAICGPAVAPAQAAPKPVSLTQVTATLQGNIAYVELTVKCAPGSTYQFVIFHVFQGETVGWNDDPTFLPTPCGTTETLFAPGQTGLFATGKAQIRTILNICEADNPGLCSTVEVWKVVRLRM